ncbi:MAG: HpcH/HpaI aldolase/citrate lyase family protein [Sagittula sp.]|uniref:HpcH/HpaI aldolase/citrate lyase family protein n=1 Tax=Sagittula sp. TaxID=2038081 RepID=UPI0040580D0B
MTAMTPRSWLFIPGDSDKKLGKADGSTADALILDLEDSVAPENKPMARDKVRDHLAARPREGRKPLLYVRINPLDETALDDLAGIMAGAPDGIMIPKTTCADDVRILSLWLDAFEATHGIEKGSTRIIPVATETAAGTLKLMEFADVPLPRMIALTWGAEDLSAAIGAGTNLDPATGEWALVYKLARVQVLLAAKAAGCAAIDTLYVDFRDEPGLRQSSSRAADEGFAGRIAIHPAQVDPINEAFAPSAEAVEHAKKVIAAFDANPGAGTVGLGGKMIDIPHLKQARNVLALHDAIASRG